MFLGCALTLLSRRSAPGVRVYFDRGMWMHRSGDWTFVDGPGFEYRKRDFAAWVDEAEHCRQAAREYWMSAYAPLPGDTVVDIGAGKGEDTIAFSEGVGPTGRVFAVEAHPITFRCLDLFQDLNALRNLVPIHAAITDRSGPVAISDGPDWQANTILARAAGSLQAPGVSLDELIERERIRRIDLLKMNIEGAEAVAIRGMGHTLRITRALCISCHDFLADLGRGEHFRTKALVREAVLAAGFQIHERTDERFAFLTAQVNAVRP